MDSTRKLRVKGEKMKKYKVFVFDLDGTLLDTKKTVLDAFILMEKELGLPRVSPEIEDKFMGPTLREALAIGYPSIPESDYDMADRVFNECYEKTILEAKTYPNVKEILAYLKEKGVPTSVYTAKPDAQMRKVFRHVGIMDSFDYVKGITLEFDTKVKLLEHVIEHYGYDVKDLVTIGDSLYDGKASATFGIDHIGVTYGYGYTCKEDAEKYGAIAVASSTEELFEIIKGLI